MPGGINVDQQNGTASEIGLSQIVIGNSTPAGSPKNSRGYFTIYTENSNYVALYAKDTSNGVNAALYLPSDQNGQTVATQNQLTNLMPKTGGTFTGLVTINRGSDGNAGLTVDHQNGTASSVGLSQVILGNSTASGTNKNSRGLLMVYSDGSNYVGLGARSGSDSTVYLPGNKSGQTISTESSSSRRVKKNIHDISDEDARKLLDIDVVQFDYISDEYGGKNECGVIAEDIKGMFPNAVIIDDNYDEDAPIDPAINPAPSVDYRKFVPYLIKIVQMQQKEIDELKGLLSGKR